MKTTSRMTGLSIYFRHHGRHDLVKETTIATEFAALVKAGKVDEDALIAVLPRGFLPVLPGKCLLMVEEHGGFGSTGQSPTTRFRSWAKYFDSYSLEIGRMGGDEKDRVRR